MFDSQPAIIDLFGHTRIAGKVTEEAVGGAALIRVDVPETDGQQAYTRYYGIGAIYSIAPTDEATMLRAARALRQEPIHAYELRLPTSLSDRISTPDVIDDEFDVEANQEDLRSCF